MKKTALILIFLFLTTSTAFSIKPKIVAGGNINTDGTIARAFNIKTAAWDDEVNCYRFKLKGAAKNFISNKFIVLITVIDVQKYTATYVSENTKKELVIFIHDGVGNKVQQNFSFLVLKI